MGSVHHAANRFGASYVDLNRHRLAATLPDLLDTCLGGSNGEVGYGHLSARRGQRQRSGPADSRSGAGYDCHPTF